MKLNLLEVCSNTSRLSTHLLGRHADGGALSNNSSLHHDAAHDRVSGIEDAVRQNPQLARENGDVLEFVPFPLLQLLPVGSELVEEMVYNVRLENLHAETVRQFLRVLLHLHVES